MPETAQPAPSDARQPQQPQYPYPYHQENDREAPPVGLIPSAMREGGGLIKVLSGMPPMALAVIALAGMSGVLLYGFVFVVPQLQKELITELNRSGEDQRELDRAMYREEGEKNRRAARERDKSLNDSVLKIETAVVEVKTAVGRVESAVNKWEKEKKP